MSATNVELVRMAYEQFAKTGPVLAELVLSHENVDLTAGPSNRSRVRRLRACGRAA